jgi:siroheme synthase (precorrin-2 oxidase/ferrochelatase)
MASIIIQSDNSDNLELIAKLAQKLGIHVNSVTEEQSEDLAIGTIMTNVKTGKSVSRDSIMKKLRK